MTRARLIATRLFRKTERRRVPPLRWPMLAALFVLASSAAAEERGLAGAAKDRDAARVRTLLAQGADVNDALPDGSTALHWAAYWNDSETALRLLRAGAAVSRADEYGVTPLILAAETGSAPVIDALLEAGADPNSALPTGETVLMVVARTGATDVLSALIAKGAKVNVKENTRGQTALMWAAAERHAGAVRLLLERGADVHARSGAGFTPLLFAARAADVDTTALLLAGGADINEAATDGTTALLTAVIRGRLEYARFLLDRGADPNRGSGYTPLHWAVGEWNGDLSVTVAPDSEWAAFGGLRGAEKLEFVNLLLASGADPRAPVTRNVRRFGGGGGNAGSLVGATPFLLAAMAGDVAVMRRLLDAGADPRAETASKTSALMLAAGLGHAPGITPVTEASALEAVALALDLGNDVNAVNAAGETALHAAAYWGADSIVRFLVEKGARINARNKKQWTPLIIAEGIYQGGGVKYFPTTADLLRKLGAEASPADIDRANGGFATPDGRR